MEGDCTSAGRLLGARSITDRATLQWPTTPNRCSGAPAAYRLRSPPPRTGTEIGAGDWRGLSANLGAGPVAAAPELPLGRHARQPQQYPGACRSIEHPGRQAGGRAGDSETQCHPALRSTREGQCEGLPTDATDIEVPQIRFRGRSQALLFHHWRSHRSLGQRALFDSAVLRSPGTSGKIIAESLRAGLHHVYGRAT